MTVEAVIDQSEVRITPLDSCVEVIEELVAKKQMVRVDANANVATMKDALAGRNVLSSEQFPGEPMRVFLRRASLNVKGAVAVMQVRTSPQPA